MSAALALAPVLQLAVVGAGPVGLALALSAARRLPAARVCVYDQLPVAHDVSGDPRTLALSQGSVLALQRLGVWAAMVERAEPIQAVHVSQQQPGLLDLLGRASAPELLIRAVDEGVPQLGAVLPYGALAAPMRAAWLAACAREPQRLSACWGRAVRGVRTVPDGVEIDVGDPGGGTGAGAGGALVESHHLAVIAEGGVFAEQARKAVAHDYCQTAWVGTVGLEGGEAGVAHERFTPQGPVALLPLPGTVLADDGRAVRRRAALVWCVDRQDDAVAGLTEAQRLAVLTHLLPARVGRLVSISPLKHFALGLNAERTLVQGRTVRIGNAAQTLHPVAGQGLNLGLRDAHELVTQLARSSDVDQALRRVEWQRAPDRWAMIAATDFLARSFTWPWPGLSTLRGAGLAVLGQVGPLKSLLARRMMFGGR
jgi:2-octaprenyl-6-methoxyphenol hydroxylase